MPVPEKMLIDSDTLSFFMRADAVVLSEASKYMTFHGKLSISVITYYEILRGLTFRKATSRIRAFENFMSTAEVVDLDCKVVDKAAEIYAYLRSSGTLIEDADILIAASALVNGFGVVTNNLRHFQRIPGLRLQNWLAQES